VKKVLASFGFVVVMFSACANRPSNELAPRGESLQALLDALQKTNDAGSARMAIDLTFASSEQTMHVTGDVEYTMDPTDPASLREHVLLDIPSLGMIPGGKIELIVGRGSVLFVRAPMLAAFIPTSTPWVKLDPSTVAQDHGGLGAGTAAVNPAAILAAIEDALTVEEVGADTVDGSGTTRYRATVDLVKLLPLLAEMSPNGPTDAEMRDARDELASLGIETLPIELWVDGDGFLKQAHVSLDPREPAGSPSFSLTLMFSDVGEDISIDVPPASQVTDVGDLLARGFPPVTSLS